MRLFKRVRHTNCRCLVLQLLSLFQLFVSFAVDAEATFTSTERIRFYIKVSLCRAVHVHFLVFRAYEKCYVDICSLLPLIVWKFRPFVFLQSASGRFRLRVQPSGTTCLSTSHLRRHSRFSDNDSRPFCFPIPTKMLSYDSCVTITIHPYCQDSRGPCNN